MQERFSTTNKTSQLTHISVREREQPDSLFDPPMTVKCTDMSTEHVAEGYIGLFNKTAARAETTSAETVREHIAQVVAEPAPGQDDYCRKFNNAGPIICSSYFWKEAQGGTHECFWCQDEGLCLAQEGPGGQCF